MKYRSFLAAAVVVLLAVASCGTRKQSVNEQLIGLWAGIDTIQITTFDTLGNINIETIEVPVAIEYYADTTMSAKVKYNDSTMANIDAVVLIGEPYVSYTGVMNVNDAKQHISGELFYQENPETLTMEFFSKDPVTGAEHKGKGTLKKQQ
ncbi:MAG: hypothetical protein IKD16_01275 [Bacteroidales bacterium]|nr:hypothetical protein [Bacteroidales bacterium]